MEFLVHIGMPKTGTTSLQNYLFNRRADLQAHSVNYVFADPNPTANPFFESFRPVFLRGRSKRQVGSIVREAQIGIQGKIKSGSLNVLSAEVLSNVDPELVAEIISAENAKYVVYVRNELEFLASSYAQLVHKEPHPPSLADFISIRMNRHNGQLLDAWRNCFKERFQPRIFDRSSLVNGDIVRDFFSAFLPVSALKLSPTDLKFEDQNPSLTDEIIAYKSHIRHTHPALVSHNRINYRAFALLAEKFGKKFRLPETFKSTLLSNLELQGKKWSQKYFGVDQVFDYSAYQFQGPQESITVSDKRVREILAEHRIILSELNFTDARHGKPGGMRDLNVQ